MRACVLVVALLVCHTVPFAQTPSAPDQSERER